LFQQVVIENKSFSEIDGGRLVGSSAIGALTSGAATLGKAAITGLLKVVGEKVALSQTFSVVETNISVIQDVRQDICLNKIHFDGQGAC
jgi:hypothetical protein